MILNPISRPEFCSLIPLGAKMLEIGPYAKPVYRRPEFDVYYADMYSIEQIRENVTLFGHDGSAMPETIHIVMDPLARPTFTTDLKFDYIFSSHNIEHIPDPINHLQEMATVAASKNTLYLLAVPDKRYCFDHYQTLTYFTDMIAANRRQAKTNTFEAVLRNKVFMTHNDSPRHWNNDHDVNPYLFPTTDQFLEHVKKCITEAEPADTQYVDTHNWVHVPGSFYYNIDVLSRLDYIPWKILSVFETAQNSNEFYAILQLK